MVHSVQIDAQNGGWGISQGFASPQFHPAPDRLAELVREQEKARSLGLPESTIERDYAQNWILKSLQEGDMGLVLKGGTGIRKTYIPNYRFSDDLDFTLRKETTGEIVKDGITSAVRKSKEESGVDFIRDISIESDCEDYGVPILSTKN